MPEATAELDHLIDRLHGRGRVRVWSLVITVFGDAIVPRGGQVSLQALQALMERLKIEPGALRTALSRLASDGWVVRHKDGRNSYYQLAAQGRHAFDEATQRIYASETPKWNGRWTVAIAVDGDDHGADALSSAGFINRGEGIWLRPETSVSAPVDDALEGYLLMDGTASTVPDNVHRLWETTETARALAEFCDQYAPFASALEAGGALEPLDALAARTLLIHDWRRIVLRAPLLPSEILPDGWPGTEARNLAKRIYARLVAVSEQWLSDNGLPPVHDMAGFSGRFGIVERISVEAI